MKSVQNEEFEFLFKKYKKKYTKNDVQSIFPLEKSFSEFKKYLPKKIFLLLPVFQ